MLTDADERICRHKTNNYYSLRTGTINQSQENSRLAVNNQSLHDKQQKPLFEY